MIYAVSDLHGCYDKYLRLLQKINLSDSDALYVLGDVVDRGKNGTDILLDMMNRKNIIPLRGNHDFIACRMLEAYIKYNSFSKKIAEDFALWFKDGGKVTFDKFIKLSDTDKTKIISYLKSFMIYDEIEVGGNNFFLSHTIPDKASMLDFGNCKWQDFVIANPEYDKQYFDDRYIVTGHIPTGYIDKNYLGRIYLKNNHIAIDCGTVFGNRLGCICLDTLEEIYV